MEQKHRLKFSFCRYEWGKGEEITRAVAEQISFLADLMMRGKVTACTILLETEEELLLFSGTRPDEEIDRISAALQNMLQEYDLTADIQYAGTEEDSPMIPIKNYLQESGTTKLENVLYSCLECTNGKMRVLVINYKHNLVI